MKTIALAAACVVFTLAIPGGVRTQPVAADMQPFDRAAKRTVVEKTGELLTTNYIFPDRAAEAKAKIDTALAAGDYDSITTPAAFAERLTDDLQSVTHDKHMQVYSRLAPGPPASATAAPAPPRVYAGFSRIDRLKGNIGYIKLMNFPDPSGPFGSAANQAITDLAGTDALIIDMRDNGGGSSDGVTYLCSFFFDPRTPVHINDIVSREAGTNEFSTEEAYTRPVPVSYLGKPVYLLTSKRTFSAGEEFLYDLQTQKRGRLIGGVTSVGANYPTGFILLSSQIAIGIPSQRAVNPVTKTNWEGTGVMPDLAVDETLAFQAAIREIVASNPAKYAALKAEVENQSAEDGFVEASLLKFRDQPQPGGEAAALGLFSGIISGKPDYAQMSDEVANRIRRGLDRFHTDMSKAGKVVSVKFSGVNSAGLDGYELRTATSIVRIGVYLGPDGKIVDTVFGPPQPLPSQP